MKMHRRLHAHVIAGLIATAALAGSSCAFAQTAETKEVFINKADLAALGCQVSSDSGTYVRRMGEQALNFRNKRDCVINITTTVTLLQYAKKSAEQYWADVPEDAERRAKKCKCQPATTQGTRGERSETIVFPGEGKTRGFTYVVQDRGVIYEVSVYSEQLQPSSELEERVFAKIDRLVAEYGGE